MPNRGSWNGRWSGEDQRWLLIRRLSNTKKNFERAEKLNGNSWHYSWSDGWGANVTCTVIEPKTSRYWLKKSAGFAGYDWMVDSILMYNRILADHEIEEVTKSTSESGVVK